jgi:hypothetical protein
MVWTDPIWEMTFWPQKKKINLSMVCDVATLWQLKSFQTQGIGSLAQMTDKWEASFGRLALSS